MYKIITSIILALVLILSFAGCAQTDADPGTTGSTAGSTEGTTEAQGIEVDENLLTVDITLPASMFEGEDMSTFDADTYADEQGFVSAKVNEDGSVTVTMAKAKYNALLKEMADSLDTAFAEFVNSEDTPYIKEITHNDDFTEVTMKVDRAAYENAFDFTTFAIGLSVSVYQVFTETESHVDIMLVDADTGETFDTVSYPMEG